MSREPMTGYHRVDDSDWPIELRWHVFRDASGRRPQAPAHLSLEQQDDMMQSIVRHTTRRARLLLRNRNNPKGFPELDQLFTIIMDAYETRQNGNKAEYSKVEEICQTRALTRVEADHLYMVEIEARAAWKIFRAILEVLEEERISIPPSWEDRIAQLLDIAGELKEKRAKVEELKKTARAKEKADAKDAEKKERFEAAQKIYEEAWDPWL